MSHYSRQSDEMSGAPAISHTVQNLSSVPLDSINRSKNGSNINLSISNMPAPSQMPNAKHDKPHHNKNSKKLPDLKMMGHAIDGGSSVHKMT